MTPKEISAANLKALRAHARLTQTEFAELHNSTQKKLWGYEKGSFAPATDLVLSLSRTYGFDPEMLSTVVFKIDASGKITNLPKRSSEIRKLKDEVKTMMNDMNGLVKRLGEMHKRLQMLENKGK